MGSTPRAQQLMHPKDFAKALVDFAELPTPANYSQPLVAARVYSDPVSRETRLDRGCLPYPESSRCRCHPHSTKLSVFPMGPRKDSRATFPRRAPAVHYFCTPNTGPMSQVAADLAPRGCKRRPAP